MLNNYKLIKISEIYKGIKEGKIKAEELVFLDEKGERVRLNKITREEYHGRIYDLTAPNHIILVKRGNLVVWSGNSNSNESNVSASIVVYKQDSDKEIAKIENITSEGWYKTYLDGEHGGIGLSDNETSDVFDLKVVNIENAIVNNSVTINGNEILYDIYQKKKRIDEIQEILGQG